MSEFKLINLESLGDGIRLLRINRSSVLNALNKEVISEIAAAQSLLAGDTATRVLIVTGEGPKSFVAGADIAEMAPYSKAQALEMARRGQAVFAAFERLPQVVIAAVNGYALGGGCELAMACDIRFASDNAKFGQPEVALGLIPGYGGTQRLARLCGAGNALYLTLSGETISAEEALRFGLVQKVLPQAELMEAVLKLAQKILSQGPEAVRLVKETLRRGLEMDFEKACELEARNFSGLFEEAQAREGMQAFIEKRKAVFVRS